MSYCGENHSDRHTLAEAILMKLAECEFTEDKDASHRNRWGERMFYRDHHADPRVQVRVYTTIVGKACRSTGKDAIRISAIYTPSRHEQSPGENPKRGIGRAKRVNRVGEIKDIVGRMYERMREVYRDALTGNRCRACGALTFRSRAGRDVCAELCWKERETA